MTPTHSVLLTIGLFGLTFLSPGPNLLIVVQSSLSSGRAAGIAAGCGVAAGDAIYAALGLFGMAALIAQSGDLFAAVKIVGGVYLLWLAWKMMKGGGAVIVSAGEFEVMGRGTVVIVDARIPQVRTLKAGMRFRFASRSGRDR